MRITLTSPRKRPSHLAMFDAPRGVDSKLLKLTGGGEELIAERDASAPVYYVHAPAVKAGASVSYTLEAIESAGPCTSITAEHSDGRVEISLCGSPLMTFSYGDDVVKPTINPILTPGGTNMLREPTPSLYAVTNYSNTVS